MTKLYTREGDDGTTGLLFGGRAAKDSALAEAVGAADEAQAAIGLVRAEVPDGSQMQDVLTSTVHDLYVLMAELATLPENHHKLVDGQTRVTPVMVDRLEAWTDDAGSRFPPLRDFVIPGQSRLAGLLDNARAITRRAERRAVSIAAPASSVIPYLNRLSSLLWALARAVDAEGEGSVLTKDYED